MDRQTRAGAGIRARNDQAGIESYGGLVPTSLGRDGESISPIAIAEGVVVSAFQNLGDRKSQEDRCTVGKFDAGSKGKRSVFFGVFDGTVGDFASENAKRLAIPCLLETEEWKQFGPQTSYEERRSAISAAMVAQYKGIDAHVLRRAAVHHDHYATCTSVTAVLVDDLLVLGHIGDSRIVIGCDKQGGLVGEFATEDHDPDLESEKSRIEANGGSVEFLPNHGNKPYIRGGDFLLRKALGEKPMQLQYARAFGAKDLKMFGCSCIPDVKAFNVKDRRIRCVILASDGIWDVINAGEAVEIVDQANARNLSPAEAIVRSVLLKQSNRKAKSDNVTAVVAMVR